MSNQDDKSTTSADSTDGESIDLDRNDSVLLEDDIGGTAIPPAIVKKKSAGVGRRVAGLLAAVLGLLGCVLSFAMLAASVRLAFNASDTAGDPLNAAVDRLETRIDQADELIDQDGVSGTDFSELRARADGLADTAAAADQAFAAIDDHVIYRWLPVDKDELGSRLEEFSSGASEVAGVVSNGSQLSSTAAETAGDRVNEMQTSVSSVDDLVNSTVDSLTSWIRLTGLGGFLLSLWSLWAQTSLLKRGWRGIRGQKA